MSLFPHQALVKLIVSWHLGLLTTEWLMTCFSPEFRTLAEAQETLEKGHLNGLGTQLRQSVQMAVEWLNEQIGPPGQPPTIRSLFFQDGQQHAVLIGLAEEVIPPLPRYIIEIPEDSPILQIDCLRHYAGLSLSTRNALARAGVTEIERLTAMKENEIRDLRGIGAKKTGEILGARETWRTWLQAEARKNEGPIVIDLAKLEKPPWQPKRERATAILGTLQERCIDSSLPSREIFFEIAEEFGVTAPYVQQIATKARITVNRERSRTEAILAALKSKCIVPDTLPLGAMTEVAEQFGVTRAWVQYLAAKEGGMTTEKEAHLSLRQLAKQLEIPHSVLLELIKTGVISVGDKADTFYRQSAYPPPKKMLQREIIGNINFEAIKKRLEELPEEIVAVKMEKLTLGKAARHREEFPPLLSLAQKAGIRSPRKIAEIFELLVEKGFHLKKVEETAKNRKQINHYYAHASEAAAILELLIQCRPQILR